MEIRVLGSNGAQLPGFNTTSFLLDGKILIDAGAVTSELSIEEQLEIDHILVTHSHLDHVRDIPFLSDNIQSKREYPVEIITTEGIIKILHNHLFNNKIWPDFSLLPDIENPAIKFRPIKPNHMYSVDKIKVMAVRLNHVVEAVSYVIDYIGDSVIFIGDTGPTDEIWRVADGCKNLKAIFVETSFPNGMQAIAHAAGHLTPEYFAEDIRKMKLQTVPVYLYHLKPQHAETIKNELAVIERKNVNIIKDGDVVVI